MLVTVPFINIEQIYYIFGNYLFNLIKPKINGNKNMFKYILGKYYLEYILGKY